MTGLGGWIVSRRSVHAAGIFAVVTVTACATPGAPRIDGLAAPGQQHPDSVLARDEAALYRAALAHASPGSASYDVERAIALLETHIGRYPASRHRADAAARLALLHEIRALRLELQELKDIDLGRRPQATTPRYNLHRSGSTRR